ncbi:hypothetical protein Tco_0776368 [Tanacetum coccineum]
MSSATSAVTYTSVYTDSEPDRAFWGADDEEVSEGGIPRVIVLGYDGLPIQPVAPPSPDYIPGPEDPQTPPVPQDEDEREPIKEWNFGDDQLRLRWMIYLVVLADVAENVIDAIGFEYCLASSSGWTKSPVLWAEIGESSLTRLELWLPEELNSVHDTFHVSNLKKCLADANLHVPLDEIKVDKTLYFVEEPVKIVDLEIRKLKHKKVVLVKVRWNSKRGPEFTWGHEDQMRIKIWKLRFKHSDPGLSHVALAGLDPEPMHDDFVATVYPQVHESLKHLDEEHVHEENPLSSTGILSSMKNLDAFNFVDQFLMDNPIDEDTGKNIHGKEVNHGTTDLELAACVTTLEKKFSNFEQKSKSLDNTTQNLGSRVFTLELRDLPHKINQIVNDVVKEAVHVAFQAPLRDRFKELPKADIKEILHQWMFETGTYKSLPGHVALYEALKAIYDNTCKRDELFAKKTSLGKETREIKISLLLYQIQI